MHVPTWPQTASFKRARRKPSEQKNKILIAKNTTKQKKTTTKKHISRLYWQLTFIIVPFFFFITSMHLLCSLVRVPLFSSGNRQWQSSLSFSVWVYDSIKQTLIINDRSLIIVAPNTNNQSTSAVVLNKTKQTHKKMSECPSPRDKKLSVDIKRRWGTKKFGLCVTGRSPAVMTARKSKMWQTRNGTSLQHGDRSALMKSMADRGLWRENNEDASHSAC